MVVYLFACLVNSFLTFFYQTQPFVCITAFFVLCIMGYLSLSKPYYQKLLFSIHSNFVACTDFFHLFIMDSKTHPIRGGNHNGEGKWEWESYLGDHILQEGHHTFHVRLLPATAKIPIFLIVKTLCTSVLSQRAPYYDIFSHSCR